MFGKYISKEKYENIIYPDFFFFESTSFISHDTATDVEKEKYKKEIETCGGFLKTLEYKEAWLLSWKKANKENRKRIFKVPNFNKKIFFDITGIDVDKD